MSDSALPQLQQPTLPTAEITFTAYGLSISIRTDDPTTLDAIRAVPPFGWKPSSNPAPSRRYSLSTGIANRGDNAFELAVDGATLARTGDLNAALEILGKDLRMFVAEFARSRIFIHAGVVGWRDRAFIIPGRSLSGKTTLVAELVRAGAAYYSDEYAVLDRHGRVHSFLKPLSIRQTRTGPQLDHPVDTLGGIAGSGPLPVGLVVVTEYREGARWRPRRLSPGEGVLALLDNAVAARRRPEAVLALLQQVTAHAPVIKGTRGDARDIATSILSRLYRGQRLTAND
jgi:hypothetical protein